MTIKFRLVRRRPLRPWRRDRQASHNSPHFRLPVADEQPHVVPRLRQPRRGELFQKRLDSEIFIVNPIYTLPINLL